MKDDQFKELMRSADEACSHAELVERFHSMLPHELADALDVRLLDGTLEDKALAVAVRMRLEEGC